MKVLIYILAIFLSANILLSQNDSVRVNKDNLYYLDIKKYALGIYGATGINSHSADFTRLGNIPNCCPQFRSGTGLGLNIGLIFQYPVSKYLELDGRVQLKSLGGDLISREILPISNIDNGGEEGSAEVEHLITADINTIGLGLSLNYYPVEFLYLKIGPEFGYVFTGEFQQEERLIKPSNRGVFKEEQSRIRNQRAGEIPNISNILFFGNIGVGYNLPLNERGSFILAPEVNFTIGLNNINNQNWKVHQFSIGLSLIFNQLGKTIDDPLAPVE